MSSKVSVSIADSIVFELSCEDFKAMNLMCGYQDIKTVLEALENAINFIRIEENRINQLPIN